MIYNCGVQIRPVEYKTDQTVVLNDISHLSSLRDISRDQNHLHLPKGIQQTCPGLKTVSPHQGDSKDEILMFQTGDKIGGTKYQSGKN